MSVMVVSDPKYLVDSATSAGLNILKKTIRTINSRSLMSKIRPKNESQPKNEIQSNNESQPKIETQPENESQFHKLLSLQDISEMTSKALLILKGKAEVLTRLRGHYRALADADTGVPLVRKSEQHVLQFEIQIRELEQVLDMEQSRAEVLLQLTEDRKNLLYYMMNQKVTDEMHQIAKKTQQETISMRIVTLITLIFLPGTFISTIMSTDIVTWDKSSSGQAERTFFISALKFFMMLTFPLIFLTLAAWAGFYWFERRRERKQGRVKDMAVFV